MSALSNKLDKLIDLEKWSEARALIEKELEARPQDHWLLERLATMLYEQRDYTAALKHAQTANASSPECPQVWWTMANCLDMLGREKEAVKLYGKIVNTDLLKRPSYGAPQGHGGKEWALSLIADSIFAAASCFERLGKRQEALQLYLSRLELRAFGVESIYDVQDVLTASKRLANDQPAVIAKEVQAARELVPA